MMITTSHSGKNFNNNNKIDIISNQKLFKIFNDCYCYLKYLNTYLITYLTLLSDKQDSFVF